MFHNARKWQWLVISSMIEYYLREKKISHVLREKKFKKIIILDEYFPDKFSTESDFSKKNLVKIWLEEKFKVEVEFADTKKVLSRKISAPLVAESTVLDPPR